MSENKLKKEFASLIQSELGDIDRLVKELRQYSGEGM